MSARVAELRIHPVKGLCPVKVSSINVLDSGRGIEHDREWAMFTSKGHYVNGKSNPRIHKVRLTKFVPPATFTLESHSGRKDNVPMTFDLRTHKLEAETWLSEALAVERLQLVRSPQYTHYCDDPRFDGPTIVSEASLDVVAGWYADKDRNMKDTIADRFRPNIILSDCHAFYEDELIDERTTHGAVAMLGSAVVVGCQPVHRCIVPTREPSTGSGELGKVTSGFYDTFQTKRLETSTLTSNPARSRFQDARPPLETAFLCVGTSVVESGTVKVGDLVNVAKEPVLLQSIVRPHRKLDTKWLQALLDGALALRAVSPLLHKNVSMLIKYLPVELSFALVTKQMPNCVPKPTTMEVLFGTTKLVTGLCVVGFGLTLAWNQWNDR